MRTIRNEPAVPLTGDVDEFEKGAEKLEWLRGATDLAMGFVTTGRKCTYVRQCTWMANWSSRGGHPPPRTPPGNRLRRYGNRPKVPEDSSDLDDF